MSIVERALRKLRAGQGAPASNAPSGPTVAEIGPALRHGPSLSVLPREDRLLHRPYVLEGEAVHVDLERLRVEGLAPPDVEQRQLADQYRSIKRPLIQQIFAGTVAGSDNEPQRHRFGARAIMVASAFPGEGKTFTSLNLALSLALEKDHTVVLVDGDVAKPHLSEVLGLAGAPGLLDVLSDPERGIDGVLRSTDIPRLSVLPVGTQSETATELLASSRMRWVIEQLETLDPAGIVVVDSPPVLVTSEARVLASLFGHVLIVVKAGSTPQQSVMEALRIIGEGPNVCFVLNQASGISPTSYYGTGYGYGYGYGSGYGQSAGMRGTEE